MSPLSILGILLALGGAVWVTHKLSYKSGHDAGYEKGETDEWVRWIEWFKPIIPRRGEKPKEIKYE